MRISPPYRIAFCPGAEARSALAVPAELRKRFSESEISRIEGLPQRRRPDRVAGRLAAKRALAAHFREEYGWNPDPRDLEIDNDAEGRPVLRLPEDAPAEPPFFSIAHCAEGGAAAVGTAGRRVGVDFEIVVSRPAKVIDFVCAPGESRHASPSDPEAQARLWTGKEAGLKLLGLGLSSDARDVRETNGQILYAGLPAEAWRALGKPEVRADFLRRANAMLAVTYTGG